MATRAWQVAAVTAALAAVPLTYWQYQRYVELKERREAIKLLRKVELIAMEVAVRLMHLETEAKELVKYETKKEAGEEEEEEEANSTLNSYYHFDSQGNKLKTKWDSYDVDAELERLEKEEHGQEVEPTSSAIAAKKPVRKAPQVTRSQILATSQGIEHEFEAVLSFLDGIRGDESVKQLRKAIASKVNKDYFARIDAIQAVLA